MSPLNVEFGRSCWQCGLSQVCGALNSGAHWLSVTSAQCASDLYPLIRAVDTRQPVCTSAVLTPLSVCVSSWPCRKELGLHSGSQWLWAAAAGACSKPVLLVHRGEALCGFGQRHGQDGPSTAAEARGGGARSVHTAKYTDMMIQKCHDVINALAIHSFEEIFIEKIHICKSVDSCS